ncbi:MAG TPA: hypothetical protein VL485_14275 [Ktedonobacteraceae bacterium]|jgi:hypothetical protein|nr:hypothetical protein [Ktedonobacteraceae bacterium]
MGHFFGRELLLPTSDLLQAIEQRVRFTRPRFGTYEVVDFVGGSWDMQRARNQPCWRFTSGLPLPLPTHYR